MSKVQDPNKIEEALRAEQDNMAQIYLTKYKRQVEGLEGGLVGRALSGRGRASAIVALGEHLDQWEKVRPLVEANLTMNSLGELPKLMGDVITAVMSNSVLPVIAQTKTIQAQKSLIKFKVLKNAGAAKGNIGAGGTLVDPRTGMVVPKGYSTAQLKGEIVVGSTTMGQATYSFTLAGYPVRREFVKVYLVGSAPAIYCQDVGPAAGGDTNIGILLGTGVSGTVNYTTGAVTIVFAVAPAAASVVKADYQTNLEAAADIPSMSYELDSLLVEARPFALKSVFGMLQQFELKQQMGGSAMADTLITDLGKEVNAEAAGYLVSEFADVAALASPVTFAEALPMGAAYTKKQYYQDYKIAIGQLDSKFIASAGRGTTKVMIVGHKQAYIASQLDDFKLLSDSTTVGPHIFGTANGIVFVRIPDESLLAKEKGIALFTGADMLEGAGLYAPYMPLMTREQIPAGVNPLNSQSVAAMMCGVQVMVPQFIQALNIT